MRHVAARGFQPVVVLIGAAGAVTETSAAAIETKAAVEPVGCAAVSDAGFSLHRLGAAFFGDDVDHASQSFGAVEHGSRAFYHLDPFDH